MQNLNEIVMVGRSFKVAAIEARGAPEDVRKTVGA